MTQTAEVEVNSASRKGAALPSLLETGSISSAVPSRITPRKPRMMMRDEVSFFWGSKRPSMSKYSFIPLYLTFMIHPI